MSFWDVVERVRKSGKVDVDPVSLYRDMINELTVLGNIVRVCYSHEVCKIGRSLVDSAITRFMNAVKIAQVAKMVLATARSIGVITEEELRDAAAYIENIVVDSKNMLVDWITKFVVETHGA